MSKFTERLWRELEREHGSQLAELSSPATRRARVARPRLLAGTTVGLAGIATALALLLSAASTPAAFAVTGNSDGTVSVVLRRVAGIKGANARLAALGVRARFVQVLAGCHAPLPPATLSADLKKAPGQVLIHASRETRIDPRKIPPGRTLVIVSWFTRRNVHVAQWSASVRAAPNCIAGPAPRALRLAWAMVHGCEVAVNALPPHAVIVRGRRAGWTISRKSGQVAGRSEAVTGNSGPFTGTGGSTTGNSGASTASSGPVPRQIKAAGGCPKPDAVPKTPPATGSGGATGNSGPFTGSSGTTGK